MSNIKYSNNIFLGKVELDKNQDSIQDDGYQKFIRDNSIEFGLINNSIDGNFENAKVIEGVGDNTILHNAILGIDTDGKFFTKVAETTDIAVGSSGADTAWYWVKAVRSESNLESGTISISATGVLTGTGTSFLTTLRGKTSDFPTKITFPSSASNTAEYEVLSVTNDTTAQLNVVSMTSESDETWQITPTNTPSSVLTTDEKKLFNYDSVTITLEAESGLTLVDGLPTAVAGEYWLARVQNSGTDVVIQDKRSNYIWKTIDGYFTSDLDKSANPLIGVEAAKFTATTDPRDKNIVELAFGMRSSNWTSDANANRVTIVAGEGGKFKSTSDFTNGDFDGWRLYFKSGKYAIIKQSTLSATQINLVLDSLDVAELTDTAQQLLVVPDCSEVEIFLTPDATTPLAELKRTFPINTPLCRMEVPVTASTADYVVTYRNKHIKDYGALLTIPDDAAIGYYTEASFNADGSLKALIDRVPATYASGTITLTQATNAYSQRLSNVETGDLFGLRTLTLDASTENNQLIVGTNFKEQIFTTPSQTTLTSNKYINLKTTGAVGGNEFLLQFEADIVLDSNEFRVVQEWDGSSALGSSGSTNLILFTFDDFYLAQSAADNLFLRCIFDGTDWKVDILTNNTLSEYVDDSLVTTLVKLRTKTFEIGDWDMDTDPSISMNHGLTFTNIRSVSVLIIDDSSTTITGEVLLTGSAALSTAIGSTAISVTRLASSSYDNPSYATTPFNRGWITITYEA